MRGRGGISRRGVLGMAAGLAALPLTRAAASSNSATPEDVIGRWYKLVLQLVRHTATYPIPPPSPAAPLPIWASPPMRRLRLLAGCGRWRGR